MSYTIAELEAFLDEGLPTERMAEIEETLRRDPVLAARLGTINARRNAGVHTLGEIWRRRRVSCPSREELGSLLLGVLDDEQTAYIQFHIEVVGCRLCQANREDMARKQAEDSAGTQRRRKKYFQSSAGLLAKR